MSRKLAMFLTERITPFGLTGGVTIVYPFIAKEGNCEPVAYGDRHIGTNDVYCRNSHWDEGASVSLLLTYARRDLPT